VRRRYCPMCRTRGVPLRDAQRARRLRLQEARAMLSGPEGSTKSSE
jgi:hypothetical protein